VDGVNEKSVPSSMLAGQKIVWRPSPSSPGHLGARARPSVKRRWYSTSGSPIATLVAVASWAATAVWMRCNRLKISVRYGSFGMKPALLTIARRAG
jgi:hypothetical protein